MARSNARSVSSVPMSPTCAETCASLPSVRQNVFFSSPPTASTACPRTPRSTGSGANPRERRIGSSRPSTTRTTESSHGTWIGRSWSSTASASAGSRSAASAAVKQMGSSERLALVITSTPPSASSRWCTGVYGSSTPSHGLSGATASASAAPGRLRSNTTGRAGEVSTAASASSISASARAASRSRTITANGLPPRALRARTVATAASDVASHARW